MLVVYPNAEPMVLPNLATLLKKVGLNDLVSPCTVRDDLVTHWVQPPQEEIQEGRLANSIRADNRH